ncbi:MAG: hypothetical protein KC445_04275, partial [Anaerolineales bacterium]|nr:hypothetical protein [Anaerolineales bacterium]
RLEATFRVIRACPRPKITKTEKPCPAYHDRVTSVFVHCTTRLEKEIFSIADIKCKPIERMKSMGTQQYKAFLLRLQRNEGQPQWRAIIENAQTGERLRFADQNQMLRYLLNDLTDISPAANKPTSQADSGEN